MCVGECMFTDHDFIVKFTDTLRNVFPVVRYAYGVFVPSYLGGQCGFMLASKDKVSLYYCITAIIIVVQLGENFGGAS